MRKILFSLLTIGLVVTGVAAGTRAYFSDTETSVGNTFTAGSLNLELGTHASVPFAVANVIPGNSGIGTYRLSNSGNLPGTLNINLKNFLQFENTLTEPEINDHLPTQTGDYEAGPNAGELNFFLGMAMYLDMNMDGVFNAGDVQLTYNGQQSVFPGFWGGVFHYHPVSNMLTAWNNVATLAAGQSANLVVMWQVPTESGDANYSQNISMTDSLQFDVEFLLNQ